MTTSDSSATATDSHAATGAAADGMHESGSEDAGSASRAASVTAASEMRRQCDAMSGGDQKESSTDGASHVVGGYDVEDDAGCEIAVGRGDVVGGGVNAAACSAARSATRGASS